jgi:hypothetical protein
MATLVLYLLTILSSFQYRCGIVHNKFVAKYQNQYFVTPLFHNADKCPKVPDESEQFDDFEFIEPALPNSGISTPTPSDGSTSKNKLYALSSTLFGIVLFVLTQGQPAVSGLALLKTMERESPTMNVYQ